MLFSLVRHLIGSSAKTNRGLNGKIRVKEHGHRLVSDIIVGYYSRDKFRKSKLLGKKNGLSRAPSSPITGSPASAAAGTIRISSPDSINNKLSALQEDIADADNKKESKVLPFDFDNNLDKIEPPMLPPITPTTTVTIHGGGDGAGPLAELRRRRRKEHRDAHQEALRQQEEQRESERRRLQADKEARSREVARAVAEAETAERARLVQAAEDAERAAPLATRLFHIVQKKAAAAVAAAVFAGGGSAGGDTGRAMRAADGAMAGLSVVGRIDAPLDTRTTDADRNARDYHDIAQLKQREQDTGNLHAEASAKEATLRRRSSLNNASSSINAAQTPAIPFDVTKTPPDVSLVGVAESRDNRRLPVEAGDEADEPDQRREHSGGNVSVSGIVAEGGDALGAMTIRGAGSGKGGVSQKPASSLTTDDKTTAADGVALSAKPKVTRDRKLSPPEEKPRLRWRDGDAVSPGASGTSGADGIMRNLPVAAVPTDEGKEGMKRHKKCGKVRTPAARRPSVGTEAVVGRPPRVIAGGGRGITRHEEEEGRQQEGLRRRGDNAMSGEQRSENGSDEREKNQPPREKGGAT